MRKLKGILFISISIVIVNMSACSIPTMDLKHAANINNTYQTKEGLKIARFQDNRPPAGKMFHKIVVNKPTPQIWSGDTYQEMMKFFQQTLEKEAAQTKLFSITDVGEYQLSEHVSSMKVDRTCTILFTTIFILTGLY